MICVTGGAGSIGSEIVRRLCADDVPVRVLDYNEEGLWSLKAELPQAEIMLGDVRRRYDVERACDGCEAVIYAAALKHVDLCESNPSLAREVNCNALQNFGGTFERFVYVSTDKAIQPESAMGRSKADGEKMAIGAGANVVRFGNVIGTRGSLVPMVQRCAALARPVPLTNPNMTRWMMDVDSAVSLVLRALRSDSRGQHFHPEYPQAVNIGRFVELCRDELAPGCPIVLTAMRPGERLHEPMEVVVRDGERDGFVRWKRETVWSNDPHYAMSDADMLLMIEQAVAHA